MLMRNELPMGLSWKWETLVAHLNFARNERAYSPFVSERIFVKGTKLSGNTRLQESFRGAANCCDF